MLPLRLIIHSDMDMSEAKTFAIKNKTWHEATEEQIPLITLDEIIAETKNIGANKAPGPDEIPYGTLKKALARNTDLFKQKPKTSYFVKTIQNLSSPTLNPPAISRFVSWDTCGKILERIIQNSPFA